MMKRNLAKDWTPPDPITFSAIGYVETQFDEPVSACEMSSAESQIIINPDLLQGLQGLQAGQRIMIIYYFHLSKDFDLLQHPRGDRSRPKRGVFTLHSPRRPNPIGVTVVDLVSIEGNLLQVRGLDALNGTPVLDMKQV